MLETILDELAKMPVVKDNAGELTLAPEFETVIAEYKKIEAMLEPIKAAIDAEIDKRFAAAKGLKKIVGEYVTASQITSYKKEFTAEPAELLKSPTTACFVKTEYKVDTEVVKAYVKANATLPACVAERPLSTYYKYTLHG